MAEISLREYLSELDRLLENGASDDVILHSRHILQSYPKNAGAYRALGRALLLNGRSDEAEAALRRVLAVIPDDFDAHVGLSEIYDLKRRGDEAIWHLERALEVQPGNRALVDSMRTLVRQYSGVDQSKVPLTAGTVARQAMLNGTYEQAIDTLRNALTRHRNRVDLRLLLAECLWASGDPVEAAETAMDVLGALPDCLAANRIMTELWLRNGRPSDAQAYLNRVQAIDPYLAVEIATSEQVEDDAYQLEHLDVQRVAQSELTATRPDWLQDIRPEPETSVSAAPPSQPPPMQMLSRQPASSPPEVPAASPAAPPASTAPAFDASAFDIDFSDLVENTRGEMPEWMNAATTQVPLPTGGLRNDLLPSEPETAPEEEDEPLDFAQFVSADRNAPAPSVEDSDPLDWLHEYEEQQQSPPPGQADPGWMKGASVDDNDRTLVSPVPGLTDHVARPNFGFSTSELREYEQVDSVQRDENDWLEQVSSEQAGVPGPRRGLTALLGDKRFDRSGETQDTQAESDEAWMQAFAAAQPGASADPSVPDWLAELNPTADGEDTPAQSVPAPAPAAGSAADQPLDIDWAAFAAPAPSDEPAADTQTPDWLAELGGDASAQPPQTDQPDQMREDAPAEPLPTSRSEEAALASIASQIQQRMAEDRDRALDAEFERDHDLILPDVPLLDLPDLPDTTPPAASDDSEWPGLDALLSANPAPKAAPETPAPASAFGQEEIARLDALFANAEPASDLAPAQAAALSWLNAQPEEDDDSPFEQPSLILRDEAAPSAAEIDWAQMREESGAELPAAVSEDDFDTWFASGSDLSSVDDWLDSVQSESSVGGDTAVPNTDDELAALFADSDADLRAEAEAAPAEAQEHAEAIFSEPDLQQPVAEDSLDAIFAEAAAVPAEDDWLAEIDIGQQPASVTDLPFGFDDTPEADVAAAASPAHEQMSTNEFEALSASQQLVQPPESESLIPAMSDAEILAMFAPEPVGEVVTPVTEDVLPQMSDEEINALFTDRSAAAVAQPTEANAQTDLDALFAEAEQAASQADQEWAEAEPAAAYEQPWQAAPPAEPAAAYEQSWEAAPPAEPATAYEQPWQAAPPAEPAAAYEQSWEAAPPAEPTAAYEQPWQAAPPAEPTAAYEQSWEAAPPAEPTTAYEQSWEAAPPAGDWFFDAEATPAAQAAAAPESQDWFTDAQIGQTEEGAALIRGLAPGAMPDSAAAFDAEAEAPLVMDAWEQPADALTDQPPASEDDPFSEADAQDLIDFAEGLPASLAGMVSSAVDTDSPFESPVDDGQDDDFINDSDQEAAELAIEAVAEPEAEAVAVAEPEAEVAPVAEPEAEVAPVAEPEAEALVAEPEAEAVAVAEPEAEVAPVAEPEAEAPVAEPEAETAVNAPDWLNAMVPGLEFDYDTEEDQQLESGFAEPSLQPALEPVEAAQPEYAWVSGLVELELRGGDEVLAPVNERQPIFRFSRRPLWAFTRRPAWSRRGEEKAAPPESGVTTELPQWLR